MDSKSSYDAPFDQCCCYYCFLDVVNVVGDIVVVVFLIVVSDYIVISCGQ